MAAAVAAAAAAVVGRRTQPPCCLLLSALHLPCIHNIQRGSDHRGDEWQEVRPILCMSVSHSRLPSQDDTLLMNFLEGSRTASAGCCLASAGVGIVRARTHRHISARCAVTRRQLAPSTPPLPGPDPNSPTCERRMLPDFCRGGKPYVPGRPITMLPAELSPGPSLLLRPPGRTMVCCKPERCSASSARFFQNRIYCQQ
jgi:hypothetical protein